MKILIYGAGVQGSVIAARLYAAGHEVSLLARGRRLADLREHGVVLEDARTGIRSTTMVPLVDALAPTDAYDLIVVCMRKNQVADVLPVLAANRATPMVLFLGNNAAGPDAYTAAVGRERVLFGFTTVGGMREGYIVRHTGGAQRIRLVIGELNGQVTPRLREVVDAFADGGIDVAISPVIDAWLKAHAALVLPLAGAVYAAGGDIYRAGHTRDAITLAVRAAREGFQALRALGFPLVPAAIQVYRWLPEPLLVLLLSRLARTAMAELAVASHANAARDEMAALDAECRALFRRAGTPTPAWEQIMRYVDPAVPILPEGSAALPLDWRSVWLLAGGLLGMLLLAVALPVLLRPRRFARRYR